MYIFFSYFSYFHCEMCWNANVSLNTYTLGLFACVFAYFNNKLGLANFLFIQTWMSMQLIEYFVWSKTFSNRLLSQIAFMLIALQPVLGILSISNTLNNVKYASLAGYICFGMITLVLKPWSKIDFSSTPSSSNGHLAWNWLKYPPPIMLIWFLFLSVKFVANKEWVLYALMCISAAITYALYHETNTWGSLWCWLSNFVSLGLIYAVFYNDTLVYYKK